MDLAASLLTFTMIWKLSWGLECYTCDPEPTHRNACAKFDYSNKFLTQCDHSTMCFKKITSMEFGDGVTSHNIERGCASQTISGEQKKINGKWRAVHDIHEVYEEGCMEDPSNSERSTKTLHCYCRGHRCNSAQRLKGETFKNVLAVITVAVTFILLS